MRYGIKPDDLALGLHGVHHDPLHTALERFVDAGGAVEEHIQHLGGKRVLILWLHNGVAALHEISLGILYRRLDHAVNIRIALAAAALARRGLVLEDKEKAPRQRFLVANILYEPQVFLPKLTALLVFFPREFFPHHGHMLIGIRFAAHRLELQLHGADLQPGRKRGDDIVLLLAAAKQKIDGQYLDDLHIAVVGGFDDPVADLPDGQEILHKLTCFASSFSAFCGFLLRFHTYIQSFCNAVFCGSSRTLRCG